MSSALAASQLPSRFSPPVERRPDDDAVVLRLGETIDETLRKGVAAVYGVLTRRGDEFLGHAVETACRRLKAQLPDSESLAATAIRFRVVPIDEHRLGVEAVVIARGGIPAGACAIAPLALFSLEQGIEALTRL